MPKLSDLLAEKAKAEIQVGGATISVTFYVLWRDRFTDDEWTEVLGLKGRDEIKRVLPKVVQSWDIVDDDGHAIPVTAEAIDQHQIPTDLLAEVEQRILGSDLAGKARNSANSRGT